MQFYFLLLLLFPTPTPIDVLVLKNGKSMQTKGPWEVKGRYVVFHTKEGDLHQLPLQLVDVDRSKAMSKPATETEAQAQQEEKAVKDDFQTWLDEQVQEKGQGQGALVANDAAVDRYGNINPAPTNGSAPQQTSSAPSTARCTGSRGQSQKGDFAGRLKSLDQDINKLQVAIHRCRQAEKELKNNKDTVQIAPNRRHVRIRDLAPVANQLESELRIKLAETKRQRRELVAEAARAGVTL